MKKVLTVSIILILGLSYISANWEFQKEENGIKVFTALKNGSQLKKCKVITSITAPLSKVYSYIIDPYNFKKFSKKVKKIRIVKKTDKHLFYYMAIDMPWPISNRDGVYQITTVSKTSAEIIIKVRARPKLIPQIEEYIRIEDADINITLTQKGEKIKIYYEKFVDPNGSIPAWASNGFLVDGQIDKFTQMKKDLEK